MLFRCQDEKKRMMNMKKATLKHFMEFYLPRTLSKINSKLFRGIRNTNDVLVTKALIGHS